MSRGAGLAGRFQRRGRRRVPGVSNSGRQPRTRAPRLARRRRPSRNSVSPMASLQRRGPPKLGATCYGGLQLDGILCRCQQMVAAAPHAVQAVNAPDLACQLPMLSRGVGQ
eukprot:CAMPEP_0117574440 /NCGR_PEP_ID=MMETSP0784-20121206/61579_1 /TAXON_ID=39447 /ORGANISM="" /LENGTH=110 /DNA_ID=CAMNT_0005373253 /DNA_START=139 /DNA_END=472 /DNA_ORIENTATION=+